MNRFPVFWQVLFAGLALMAIFWFFSSGTAKALFDFLLTTVGLIIGLMVQYFSNGINTVIGATGFGETLFAISLYFVLGPLAVFVTMCGIFVGIYTLIVRPAYVWSRTKELLVDVLGSLFWVYLIIAVLFLPLFAAYFFEIDLSEDILQAITFLWISSALIIGFWFFFIKK